MATPMTLFSSYLALAGVDRSSWCKKIELTTEVEEKDVTTFASLGWKAVLGGLKSGGLSVDFFNDIQSGQLDETMWTLLTTGVVTFEVRATSAAASTSNPKYTGSVLINKWTPISGSPGDVNGASYTFPTSGVVTRATA